MTFATGTTCGGTEVGGLSALDYDAARSRFYALSDDRPQIDDARFYTLTIDLSDGDLEDGDVAFNDFSARQLTQLLAFEVHTDD